jgi:hypothetical protein
MEAERDSFRVSCLFRGLQPGISGFRRGKFPELGSARFGPKSRRSRPAPSARQSANPRFAADQPPPKTLRPHQRRDHTRRGRADRDLRSRAEASSTRAGIIIQKMAASGTMQARRRPGMPPMGHRLEALIFRFELFFVFRLVFVGFAVVIPS